MTFRKKKRKKYPTIADLDIGDILILNKTQNKATRIGYIQRILPIIQKGKQVSISYGILLLYVDRCDKMIWKSHGEIKRLIRAGRWEVRRKESKQ